MFNKYSLGYLHAITSLMLYNSHFIKQCQSSLLTGHHRSRIAWWWWTYASVYISV